MLFRSYSLQVPPEALGPKSITAQLQVTNSGVSGAILAKPDPLILNSAPRPHTADVNGDYRISLVELTRVIELYNTRTGTTRTGQYKPQSGTEDGFAPGP